MSTITIRKDVNFKDIEELSKKIIKQPNTTLRLPNTLNTSGIFGIEGLVLQLIATWLRTEGNHILHTFVDDPEDENQFSDMCNSLYGICALSLSSEILSVKKIKISRKTSLSLAVDRIKKVRDERFSEAFKGFYLTIPSIKAPRNNSEFLSPFYNGERVVGRGKFLQITKDALSAVIKEKRNNYLSDSIIINLSEIIRELFTNTHKHARKCVNGNVLEKNFRSVSFRISSVRK